MQHQQDWYRIARTHRPSHDRYRYDARLHGRSFQKGASDGRTCRRSPDCRLRVDRCGYAHALMKAGSPCRPDSWPLALDLAAPNRRRQSFGPYEATRCQSVLSTVGFIRSTGLSYRKPSVSGARMAAVSTVPDLTPNGCVTLVMAGGGTRMAGSGAMGQGAGYGAKFPMCSISCGPHVSSWPPPISTMIPATTGRAISPPCASDATSRMIEKTIDADGG